MIIRLERIQVSGHRYYEDILKLYIDSFPKEERREPSALAEILRVPDMHFCAVLAGNVLAGLVVYWKFERYLYIEHLAVFPLKQGNGIGSKVLKLIQNEGNPILLEVEIPFDATSQKRTEFYARAGFMSLNISYLQPPYRKGEQLLPMMLYSDHSDWNLETLDECIHEFHSQVYNYP
jgi:hypothetical protein